MKRRQLLALSLLAGLLLAPLAASADQHEMAPKPLTWLSYVQSQTGKSNQLSQYLAKNGAETYDALMADGHIITWGVAMPVNHWADDDWNIVEWVTFRDWAAVDTFMQGFMARQMAKSLEQMMAEQKEWLSLVEPGSHYDEILRHMVVVPAPEAGRPGYYNLTWVPVKPGKGPALKKLWQENVQPTLAEMQGAGKVGAFGLAAAEIHDGTGSQALFWSALPNLAAREAIDAAMAAAAAKRGEEAQKQLMESFNSLVDLPGHHDRLLLVTHYGGSGAGEAAAEGEGGGEAAAGGEGGGD